MKRTAETNRKISQSLKKFYAEHPERKTTGLKHSLAVSKGTKGNMIGQDGVLRDFLHHLHDTIILLGVEDDFANLLKDPNKIIDSDVDKLRALNGNLIDATKTKLVNINKITIKPQNR